MTNNQKNTVWCFAVFLLSFFMFSRAVLGDIDSPSSSDLDYGLLSGVCGSDSIGIEEAAVYIGEGPHPVVLLDNQEADKHEWNDSLTSDWQPEAISTTQLVGCIEEENELIETCNYEGGRLVKRYIRHLNIDLHEAHNGKKIGDHEFIGGVPDTCHLTETFYNWQYVKVKYGSRVTFEEVEIWLTDYVNASIPAVKSMPWIPLLLDDRADVEATIQNGNFESGSTAWTEYSAGGWDIIGTSFPDNVAPHSGSYAAWLGGAYDDTTYIRQTVAVPSSSPTLTFYHWIASAESICTYDLAYIRVNGSNKDTLGLCSSNNTGGWVPRSINLSGYAGQNISLEFRSVTNSSLNSNWFIDDVSFQ